MKKFKKVISLLLAISMILAMSVSAFAAEPAAEISKFAGKTMTVGLYRSDADGATVREELHVYIPDNATVETQCQLVNAAVMAMEPMPMSNNDFTPMGTTDLKDGTVRLTQADLSTPSGAKLTDEITLDKDYEYIYVQFYDIEVETGNPTAINVRIQNNNHVGSYNVYRTGAIDTKYDDASVFMQHKHFYGGGTCYLNKGDNLSVWGSTDTGTLNCSWWISAS